jgi:hypothetical protein
VDDEADALFLRYCTDIILNILWYERARKDAERKNRRLTALMVFLMAVALVLIGLVGMSSASNKGEGTPTAYSLTLLAGATFTVLQILATMTDAKSRLSIFWKAGADLKEKLYSFERQWCGKVFDDEKTPKLSAAFAQAAEDDLKSARAITRAERLEFFATIKSPNDVLAIAIAAADTLRARRADAQQTVSGRDQRIADAKKAGAEARASLDASQSRLAEFKDGTPEKAAEAITLIKAKAEVVRTDRLVDELVSG